MSDAKTMDYGRLIKLKIGDVLRVDVGLHGLKDRSVTGPFHVRGIVDGRLIVRWYGKYQQGWHYEIMSELSFGSFKVSVN